MDLHRESESCGAAAAKAEAESGLGPLAGRRTCSIEEAARILGIGRSTAYAAARDGSLPTLRISNRILVPTAKLAAMLGAGECRSPRTTDLDPGQIQRQ